MTTLIDANNLLYREMNNEQTIGGTHSIRMLYNKLSLTEDDLTILVWDGYDGNKRRRDVYPEYKGNRTEKGEDVYAIFKLFSELMSHTKCMQIKVPTWEADDVIFTLAKYFTENGDTVVVNTNDADYLQMADLPNVTLPLIRPWAWDNSLIITYKALVGDPSDNIPGMPGFGEGAWGHTRTYHETMRECLKENNWGLWQTLAFPKRNQRQCLDKGNFDRCVMFYNLVQMLDVSLDDIAAHSTVGKSDPGAADALLAKFYL